MKSGSYGGIIFTETIDKPLNREYLYMTE